MRVEDLPTDPIIAAWVALVRAGNSVISAVRADGSAAGFPPLEWYDVLWELESTPEGGVRPFELEGRLLLAQYNLSRLIDRMLKAGYVAKQPCPEDGRGHILVVTEEGKALRKRMWPVYRASIERHIGSHLGEAEARSLCRLLVALIPEKPGRPK
jgi:DNA-binding MarR family transcriptional regulator